MARSSPSSCLTYIGVNRTDALNSVYQMNPQGLAGQLQFHCGMERDGSVEMDWILAQPS